jgi:hypothetical protein
MAACRAEAEGMWQKRQAQALVIRAADRRRLAVCRVPHRARGGQGAGVKQRKKNNPRPNHFRRGFFVSKLFLFCEVLLFAVGGDAADKLQWQRLIQRKLHRAAAELVCA